MNEVLKTIAGRRSVRQYRTGQIAEGELLSILEAGMQAPSGHNDQSCYFTAVQNPDLIDRISQGAKIEMKKTGVDWIMKAAQNENMHIFYHAPTVVIVSVRKDAVSPMADVCASIENMMLAAESLNIGSCWIGFARFFFMNKENDKVLPIPDGYEVQYAVSFGYKPENFQNNPPPRKYESYYTIVK